MLKIVRVRNEIVLKKKLGVSNPFKSKKTHQEITKTIIDRGFDCASVIICREPLDNALLEDPRHCKMTREIERSEFEVIVRKEAERHYPELSYVLDLMKKKFPDRVTNQENGNSSCHKVYRSELEKKIWEAYNMMYFSRIFWDMRVCVYNDLLEDFPDLTSDLMNKKIWDEMFQMMLPTVRTEFEQLLPFGEPFTQWSDKNKWQQWYFIDKGEQIDYAIGGAGSSYYREQHGLFAHVFAALSQRGFEIPTYVFHVDEFNQAKFLKGYDCFKAMKNELNANYQVDWSKTKVLFKNKLLSFNKKSVHESM